MSRARRREKRRERRRERKKDEGKHLHSRGRDMNERGKDEDELELADKAFDSREKRLIRWNSMSRAGTREEKGKKTREKER